MSCSSCQTAQQRADHRDYREGCLGCQVRKLTHDEPTAREAMLDRIQFVHGHGARSEVIRLIELERARIKNLRRGRDRR
jgi:hypothetical protein